MVRCPQSTLAPLSAHVRHDADAWCIYGPVKRTTLLRLVEYSAGFRSEPRLRGSAGRIMIRPGQAIMIAWLTTAHAPLWEPAHERAPPQKRAYNLIGKCALQRV